MGQPKKRSKLPAAVHSAPQPLQTAVVPVDVVMLFNAVWIVQRSTPRRRGAIALPTQRFKKKLMSVSQDVRQNSLLLTARRSKKLSLLPSRHSRTTSPLRRRFCYHCIACRCGGGGC